MRLKEMMSQDSCSGRRQLIYNVLWLFFSGLWVLFGLIDPLFDSRASWLFRLDGRLRVILALVWNSISVNFYIFDLGEYKLLLLLFLSRDNTALFKLTFSLSFDVNIDFYDFRLTGSNLVFEVILQTFFFNSIFLYSIAFMISILFS